MIAAIARPDLFGAIVLVLIAFACGRLAVKDFWPHAVMILALTDGVALYAFYR